MSHRRTIAVPWDAPATRTYNGQHPLPSSLIRDSEEFVFRSDLQAPSDAALAQVRSNVGKLHKQLVGLAPAVSEADIANFIASRDLASQVSMEVPADLLFLHTCPMTLGQRPWAIHVETLLPLFEPYFGHFRTWDIDLDAQPAYHMVRHLLRHENCRAIFTHLFRTRDDIPLLFQDEGLASKVFYAPLGLDLPPEIHARAEQAVARKDSKAQNEEFVIMFTNSWHQMGDSFFKRGGMEAIMAFFLLLETHPTCRLLLRSPLPDQFNEDFRSVLRGHPRIELYEKPVPDDKLFALLERADAFLLPSAGLHTISLLRAMAAGAVVVTTDVTSIGEFVRDGETGFILPGRHGVTYREDRARGLLREQSDPLKEVDAVITSNIAATLARLATDLDLRRRVRHAARSHVLAKHGMGPWRDGFHAMLRAAIGPAGDS